MRCIRCARQSGSSKLERPPAVFYDLARRQSEQPVHPVRHMALMRKTCFQRHLAGTELALQQECLCAVDATLHDVSMHRHAKRLAKQHLEMRHAKLSQRGELVKRQ